MLTLSFLVWSRPEQVKLSPLEHCISRPVPPQHPHSLLWPHWVCSADPGQQSRQQSSSFQRLWSSTLTSLPDTTASKPTTTSFSPRGYTNTPEQVRRTAFISMTSVCFPIYQIFLQYVCVIFYPLLVQGQYSHMWDEPWCPESSRLHRKWCRMSSAKVGPMWCDFSILAFSLREYHLCELIMLVKRMLLTRSLKN